MNLEERWRNPISDEDYEKREKENKLMLKGKYKALDHMIWIFFLLCNSIIFMKKIKEIL